MNILYVTRSVVDSVLFSQVTFASTSLPNQMTGDSYSLCKGERLSASCRPKIVTERGKQNMIYARLTHPTGNRNFEIPKPFIEIKSKHHLSVPVNDYYFICRIPIYYCKNSESRIAKYLYFCQPCQLTKLRSARQSSMRSMT